MRDDGPSNRAPMSSYPAPERVQSGMEPSAWDRPGMHAEEHAFRSFSASPPSHALPGAYPWPPTAMQVAQMQAAQRLLAMGQYGMGPGSWPSGHYSAGTRPTRPVLDQLHHHYEHGHRHMQVDAREERLMEQQRELERRQMLLQEERMRVQAEQLLVYQEHARLQAQARAQAQAQAQLPTPARRGSSPPRVSREERREAAMRARSEEDSDGTSEAESQADEGPSTKRQKKALLCQVPDCGKVNKGGGFCKFHGGGTRCTVEGCTCAARGSSGLCINHGGGPRCQMPRCDKSARTVGGYCKAHGGGRKCKAHKCRRTARGDGLCREHADQSALEAHLRSVARATAPRPSPSLLYPLGHPPPLPLPAYHPHPLPFGPMSPYGLMDSGMMGSGMMGSSMMGPSLAAAAFGHGPDMAGLSRTDPGYAPSPSWDTALQHPQRPPTDTQPGRRGGASNRPAHGQAVDPTLGGGGRVYSRDRERKQQEFI